MFCLHTAAAGLRHQRKAVDSGLNYRLDYDVSTPKGIRFAFMLHFHRENSTKRRV